MKKRRVRRDRAIFRDGLVHVLSRMCDTCIFRSGNLMHLRPGLHEQMIREAVAVDGAIPCHETLGDKEACCFGFFKMHATMPLQIADRMGFIEFVDPPKVPK